ncbi:hypothetical protein CLV28_2320 [Sediminihabitans luteus]|uniref:Uncharacterized protein n=1 Tax=Sediminihabitans luteus TaxID=1138585 RepID=A0A2M9CD99_9CELL|nr:hypothetical protein [Sediminihabitans luteus]PJJ69845.1 hypothetical protein CLV28_2320 [Sediminihabitans luteus]GIJ00629.1 hypothetical protein Slu03_30060 [Sediminihabitans luteus]
MSTPEQPHVPDAPGHVPASPGGASTQGHPPQAGYPHPQQQQPPQGYGAPAAAAPVGNPFAGVPWRDYATDAGALVLLCVSLAMPWWNGESAASRLEVLLLTILSLVSLSLFYLARAGSLPASWDNRTVLTVRLAANVPYVLVAFAYLVVGLVSEFSDGAGIVGPALGVGLGGALLAATPRAAELGDHGLAARQRTLWSRVLVVLGVYVALHSILLMIALGTSLGSFFSDFWTLLVLSALAVATAAVAVLVPLCGVVLRGDAAWRPVALAVGATATVFFVIASSNDVVSALVGTLLAPAVAAIVLAPVFSGGRLEVPAALRTASAGLLLAAVLAGLGTLSMLFLVIVEDEVSAVAVTSLILVLVIGAAALAGRSMVRGDQTQRVSVLVVTAVMVVLGIVVLVLDTQFGEPGTSMVAYPNLLLGLALPGLAAAMLLAPASVRKQFGALFPTSPGAQGGPRQWQAAPGQPQPFPHQQAGYPPAQHTSPPHQQPQAAAPYPQAQQPQPQAAAPYPQPAPAPASGWTAQQAADPTTPLASLHRIVLEEPSLRPLVAANPSTYPDLLTWLGSLGDPQVDAALRARGR